MIDWIAHNTLTTSMVLVLIIIIRIPARKVWGSNISYSLWVLPILVIILPPLLQSLFTEEIWLSVSATLPKQVFNRTPQFSLSGQTDWLFIVWITGVMITGIYKFSQRIQFNYHALLNAKLNNSQQWKLETGRIAIATSNHVETPCISGIFFPTIYLPQDFESDFTESQQRLIIQHELQHHKKGDLWLLMLAETYITLFWFNPLVHLCKKYFVTDQELACDRQVLKNACPQTRLDYGQALHQGLLTQLKTKQKSPMTLSFFSVKHQRFIMLNKHQNNKSKTLIGFTLMGLLSVATVALSQSAASDDIFDPTISFNFEGYPLPMAVQMIADATEAKEEFVNFYLTQKRFVTAVAKNESGFKQLDKLLAQHGLKVSRTKEKWIFSEL